MYVRYTEREQESEQLSRLGLIIIRSMEYMNMNLLSEYSADAMPSIKKQLNKTFSYDPHVKHVST